MKDPIPIALRLDKVHFVLPHSGNVYSVRTNSEMDLVNIGSDPWILEQEACEVLSRDIFELLNQRANLDVSSKEFDALSARIRNRLRQFTSQVDQLNKKLELASVISSITSEEHERRTRQVDVLQSSVYRLQDEFNKRKGKHNVKPSVSEERSQLLGYKNESSVIADMGTTSWGDMDFNQSASGHQVQGLASKTVDQLRDDQEKMLKEQDEGLDSLSKIISRQKQIATTINVEVDQQNELLDNITRDMEDVEGRIERETNMVRVIGRKDSTWGYWLVIVLLLIAILAVAFS